MKKEIRNKIKRTIAILMTASMLLTVVTVSNMSTDEEYGIAPCCDEVKDSGKEI